MNTSRPHLVLTLIVATAILSYGAYRYGVTQVQKELANVPPKAQASNQLGPESIIKNQQALAVGTITKREGNLITVTGDDGQQATFKLAPTLRVYSLAVNTSNPPVASFSALEQTTILTNKKALISLQFQNNDYQVIDIAYTVK